MGVNPDARDLLGAYALDALDDTDAATVETLVADDRDAAYELHRLRGAAAWIGATEALEPPRDLRAQLLARAKDVPTELRSYRMAVARHEALLDELTAEDLTRPTANGLSVGDLVVHLASMESGIAETVGHEQSVTAETDVDTRTEVYLAAYGADPMGAGRGSWRVAAESLDAWATAGGRSGRLPWAGAEVDRRTLLATRSFELWTHDDDIRAATGRERLTPTAPELRLMSDIAVSIMPFCLLARGHKVSAAARFVLTGEGGGEWTVSLDGRDHSAPTTTLTVDVVDFCRLVAERIDPDDCGATLDGDVELGRTLLHCASALATL